MIFYIGKLGRVADQRMSEMVLQVSNLQLSQDVIFLERRNLKKVVEMVTSLSICKGRGLAGGVVSRKSRLN